MPQDGRNVHEETVSSGSDGRFLFSGTSNQVLFHVSKPSYYATSVSFDLNKYPKGEPVLTLRRILRPQAMIGKKALLRVPIGTSHISYDFLAGDCLPPIGNGVIADLEITRIRPVPGGAEACWRAFTSQIVGTGNGVVVDSLNDNSSVGRGTLLSQYEAPTEGYQPSCDFGNHMRGRLQVAYIKIRSEQPGGPMFGKLLDPISYWADFDADEFEFEYVINRSGARGMEMNMKLITVPAKHESEYAPEEF